MATLTYLNRLYKTTKQLGLTQVGLFALYKLGLKTGYYKWNATKELTTDTRTLNTLFDFPSQEELLSVLGKGELKTLLAEADQIVDGKFRIFGGELVDIKLDLSLVPRHWTEYETRKAKLPATEYRSLNTALNLPLGTCDLKLLWEPARFGWAFTLGRAFHATDERKYAEAFWRYFEIFDKANPVNMGPHWMNGQEVALRLMVLIWAAQAFAESSESTSQRKARLAESITQHAIRITQTLIYARSQNNNHLISEAAALYTAAFCLPDHPRAEKWKRLGIKWLNWSFENQIDEKGEYIQHSVNYHRLILQLALWVTSVAKGARVTREASSWMTEKARQNLENATRWLADLTDPVSGNTPNRGANDGAYIFPLANGNFRDMRPVVQAASQAFLNEMSFEAGAWDEMGLWFNVQDSKSQVVESSNLQPSTLKPSPGTWASLRIADGNLRLAHADQLHLDLWWQGQNIALDPGTYLYNADPPWDNPLAATEYHNTVTVNNLDQMTRTSRFMYLDWSRAQVIKKTDNQIVAEHNGYQKLGVTHRRTVSFAKNIWHVEDNLAARSRKHEGVYRLHWLLADGEWELKYTNEKVELILKTESGIIKIIIRSSFIVHRSSFLSLARAGKLLHGSADVPPTRGWYSPTYGIKVPALSLALEVTAFDAVQFITEFKLIPNS